MSSVAGACGTYSIHCATYSPYLGKRNQIEDGPCLLEVMHQIVKLYKSSYLHNSLQYESQRLLVMKAIKNNE